VSAGETIREFLSFRHAFRKEKDAERIRQAVNKWGRKIGDTGSYEVQSMYNTFLLTMMDEIIINDFFFFSCCNHNQDTLDE